ncbi:MAG TPA: DUF2075 domain-containing protein [Candidatus Tumulicola sp.]|nr:DUF2075 domain-containing protein [Candidatus Tumulicola sp.]
MIIELKQWDKADACDIEECVVTYLGGRDRVVPHPSVQACHYRQYLMDSQTVYYEPDPPVGLSACSYLHNLGYDPSSPLHDKKFEAVLSDCPMFAGNQAEELASYLRERVSESGGDEVLQRVLESKYRASKKLLDHVSEIIQGNNVYTLLDEQIVVYNTILGHARRGFHGPKKAVILVKGGPGTGKSLIAVNVMATLAKEHFAVQHATGSKAFTENLRREVGRRAASQFKYFNSFVNAEDGALDVLICDEAHRIRESSNNRFTPKSDRSDRDQVGEIVDAAKVAVFLIDDHQVVRPGEIGSSELVRRAAENAKATLVEEELQTQFRCAGSEAFVSWVDNTLGIRETRDEVFEASDAFEFRVLQSPEELAAAIEARAHEGYTGRLVAGFCWPWSDPKPDGTLVDDVAIGTFHRPWNARPQAGRLANGIPQSSFWAADPNGLSQIGCIYTAQGFEFDYVGVIFGKDLAYSKATGEWVGRKEFSRDSFVTKRAKESFVNYVRNTYRVLLTRGMKGCYVYFMDVETEEFVRGRLSNGRY